ncbi:MAG: DUF1217 domain-containing protein [Maritimibacter sp.]
MTFQPIIPFSGASGWAFLQRTQEAQQDAFEKSPLIERDTAYFEENISKITSGEELVKDYRLLKVALGAFGLDEDLPNKAFIQKVLDEGTLDEESFSNRMVDKRYFEMSKAFGFDLDPPNTQLSDFSTDILANYKTRQFEIAVGEQSTTMRLALGLERDLGDIIEGGNTPDGQWYSVMGNEPLREVFETALGLPATFAALDIDKQLGVFREKAQAIFGEGEVSQFADPDKLEELNRLFLVRSQIAEGTSSLSSGAIALTLLQSI